MLTIFGPSSLAWHQLKGWWARQSPQVQPDSVYRLSVLFGPHSSPPAWPSEIIKKYRLKSRTPGHVDTQTFLTSCGRDQWKNANPNTCFFHFQNYGNSILSDFFTPAFILHSAIFCIFLQPFYQSWQLDCSGVVMSSSRETHPPVSSQGYVIFLSLEMSGWCVALHPRQDTGLTFILHVHHLLCLIKGSSYNISIPLLLYSYTIEILWWRVDCFQIPW